MLRSLLKDQQQTGAVPKPTPRSHGEWLVAPAELLLLVTGALGRLSIPYLVTCSMATVAYSEPRLTNDLDIVAGLSPDAVDQLCAAFPADQFYLSRDAALDAIATPTNLPPGRSFRVVSAARCCLSCPRRGGACLRPVPMPRPPPIAPWKPGGGKLRPYESTPRSTFRAATATARTWPPRSFRVASATAKPHCSFMHCGQMPWLRRASECSVR